MYILQQNKTVKYFYTRRCNGLHKRSKSLQTRGNKTMENANNKPAFD